MARIKVTDPETGVVVEVESDSPLAARWEAVKESKPAPTKSSPTKG